MRPCDDTFGLVRGNRRKAVFAFKGLFTEGHLFVFASGSGFLSRISEVRGKIETCRAHSYFCQQNRRSQGLKSGIWSAGLGFSPHFRMYAKYGFNVLGLESHNRLPIGYKTNIVSIMLTKGWL